jgi:hypothetical protein
VLAKLKNAHGLQDYRIATDPVELIRDYLRHFRVSPGAFKDRLAIRLETNLPPEILEELAERFALFAIDGKPIDKAFGGGTKRLLQQARTMDMAWEVTSRVLDRQLSGESFEDAVAYVSGTMNIKEDTVKKHFARTRPSWK